MTYRMRVDLLLVDDDALQAGTRKSILERAGHLVRVETSALRALDFLRSSEGSTTRMVITDHLMPGMNGPDFVKNLRASGFRFPVLVLSGYADAEDDYEMLDVAFRVKPFPPDQLISLIAFLLVSSERRSA